MNVIVFLSLSVAEINCQRKQKYHFKYQFSNNMSIYYQFCKVGDACKKMLAKAGR